MPTFVRRTPMPVSARALYDWHRRPGAFERLGAPWAPPRVIERAGDFEHLRITLEVPTPIGPRRLVAQHRDVVDGVSFVDEQVEGPFARWVHTHRCIPDGATSILEDSLEWALPLGGLGGWVAQAELERMFTFRHARTLQDLTDHARWSQEPRTIAITGARGLVGETLQPFLSTGGHTVRRVVRGAPRSPDIGWDPAAGHMDAAALAGIDSLLHLSGEPINTRWTDAAKAEILRSRVDSTRLVAETLAKMERPPRRLVCASAIGIYGDRGDAPVDEDSAPGEGFLPEVCEAWEAAAEPARKAGIEVVHVRIGVVLSGKGGALPELARPFRMGVGGVVGTGRQVMSWVSMDDLCRMFLWLLTTTDHVTGPINATAPHPVTNRELTEALGAALHRPTLFPVPGFAIRAAFGEMGQHLILEGARVLPTRATAAGFPFVFPEVGPALRWELGTG